MGGGRVQRAHLLLVPPSILPPFIYLSKRKISVGREREGGKQMCGRVSLRVRQK